MVGVREALAARNFYVKKMLPKKLDLRRGTFPGFQGISGVVESPARTCESSAMRASLEI